MPGSNIEFCKHTLDQDEKLYFINLLNELDKNPSELLDFLSAKNSHLLGKYFEALVEFWLNKSPSKELLVSNLQINSNSQTIGEIDFIYKDFSVNKLIHLETVGKFFLWINDNFEFSSFVGPNPNDSLDKKIFRIINYQIPLVKSDEGRNTLKLMGIKDEIESKVLFKGYLFTPIGKEIHASFIYDNFFRGFWLRSKELNMIENRKSFWKILKRKEWVSPYFTDNKSQLSDWNTIKEKIEVEFTAKNYPILLSEIIHEENNFAEKNRFFITPPEWIK